MNLSNYFRESLKKAHEDVLTKGKDLLDSLNSILSLTPVVLNETNYCLYESYKRKLIERKMFFMRRLEEYQKAFYYELSLKDYVFVESREESGL